MFSVIMGKSKAVQGDLLGNRVIWVNPTTKTLNSYNLDTNTNDINVVITGLTTPYALDWDANYIYIAGQFSAAPHVRKINRATLVQSNLANNTEPSGGAQRALCNDTYAVYVGGVASTRKYGKLIKSTNNYTSIATSGTSWVNISQNTDSVYATASDSSTAGSIRRYLKSTNAAQVTLSAIDCYGALADDNNIYILNSINKSLTIYDTTLTNIQSGWNVDYMWTNGFKSIVQDSGNIYGISNPSTGSYGIRILNKTTKTNTYFELKNSAGNGLLPMYVMINGDYLYIARYNSTVTDWELMRANKSDISNLVNTNCNYDGGELIIIN